MVISTQKCRIERLVSRGNGVNARFRWLTPEGKIFYCCDAVFDQDGTGPYFSVTSERLSLEEASIVSIAISMALEWATEMMAREPENTGCLPVQVLH